MMGISTIFKKKGCDQAGFFLPNIGSKLEIQGKIIDGGRIKV